MVTKSEIPIEENDSKIQLEVNFEWLNEAVPPFKNRKRFFAGNSSTSDDSIPSNEIVSFDKLINEVGETESTGENAALKPIEFDIRNLDCKVSKPDAPVLSISYKEYDDFCHKAEEIPIPSAKTFWPRPQEIVEAIKIFPIHKVYLFAAWLSENNPEPSTDEDLERKKELNKFLYKHLLFDGD